LNCAADLSPNEYSLTIFSIMLKKIKKYVFLQQKFYKNITAPKTL